MSDSSAAELGGPEDMKANQQFLDELKDISNKLKQLSAEPDEHELDTDAVVDLNLARASVDKLIHRVERILE